MQTASAYNVLDSQRVNYYCLINHVFTGVNKEQESTCKKRNNTVIQRQGVDLARKQVYGTLLVAVFNTILWNKFWTFAAVYSFKCNLNDKFVSL